MNERKFDAGSLAEQIDAAKKSIEALPEQWRDSTKFQGRNHSFDDSNEVGGQTDEGENSQA